MRRSAPVGQTCAAFAVCVGGGADGALGDVGSQGEIGSQQHGTGVLEAAGDLGDVSPRHFRPQRVVGR